MLIREFNVKMIRGGRPGITADKSYPVLGMTGTLNDTAFFVPDDTGKITFIKLGDAHLGDALDTNIALSANSLPDAFMEAIEALTKKVASLQGQISALKAKKGE